MRMRDVQDEGPSPDLLSIDELLVDGQLPEELRIRLTPEALAAARALADAEPRYAGLALRVYLDGKGCDGFYYGVTFDPETADDVVFPHDGLRVVADKQTLRFVLGATVTWIDDERGRGFLVDNPGHKRYRGKFYKRKAWQEALTTKDAPR
jgi:iron-sulfur cluster insertion protein